MNDTPPLLVFADDWGRHPSSCQHIIRELLPIHRVLWVNTIGTRPPQWNLSTVKRGLGKLRQWSRPAKTSTDHHDHLQVLNPRMWPGFSTSWQRRLNKTLLARQLVPVLQKEKLAPVAITTIPLVADMMKFLPVRSWVYYCVDDFSTWPGLDGKTLGSMELEMLPQTDTIISASEHLQERLQHLGYPSSVLTHGVNLEFWKSPVRDHLPDLDSTERPLIVFWGVIDKRMDLDFISQLARDLDRGTIILAGPEDDPYPEVKQLPRVKFLGSLPLKALPGLAEMASILIMPYADLPVTRAMQPLKLKEYLATGKPCVVRDLPANKAWGDCLDLVDTPDAFVRQVKVRLDTGTPPDQLHSRSRLAKESWKSKAEMFAEWILHNKKSYSSTTA